MIKCVLCYLSLVLDADLRFALDNPRDKDIARHCLVYVHKVVNAKGEREKGKINSQLQLLSQSEVKVIHHFLMSILLFFHEADMVCT